MTDPFDLMAPTGRLRVPMHEEGPDGVLREGYMECDVPINATPEQIQAATDSMRAVHEEIRAFHAQSEEEKLKHYLRIATDALTKIMNDGSFDVREWDQEPTKELVHDLRKRITDAGCGADMALIQIPTNLRSQKNDS